MKAFKYLTIFLIIFITAFVSLNANTPEIKKNETHVNTQKEADKILPPHNDSPAINNDTQSEEINEIIPEETEVTKPTLNSSDNIENHLECTLSVKCTSVLQNISKLDKEKLEILPSDGIIFPETKVIFYDGESAYNILAREMKKNQIHIDIVNTPMYNTVYIRGISNLYEHDCGELSGWLYLINGKTPPYGCSQYILNNGDRVEFVYTCDLGADVDGNYLTRNGNLNE